jgi:class 3 adenylate cyclase
VIDLVEDERLGSLALAIPFVPPPALILEDGTPLEVGIHIDNMLFGTSLRGAGRESAIAALSALGDRENARFMNDGSEYVAHARTISHSPPTQFVAIVSLAPLVAAERELTLRMSIGAAVALCVGLIITLYLARTLSRPVADMSAAAAAIESGDYSVRVPVRDRGELGALAARFNSMGEGLALRDQYRRVLDVVADPEVARELMAGKLDLGGRSQDVGVLFCDIRGFTALTERMDPPQVITMLNEHMSLMTGIAYEHGGVVDKFVGDLIMVTFGAPKAAADDAARMVACARAMIEVRQDANARMATPILVGIGCAFGTVVAGCMGSTQRLDYTVLGARVNLAARLCSRAPAMCVYIDAETKARACVTSCVPLAAFDVKGFSQPILAFQLERATECT